MMSNTTEKNLFIGVDPGNGYTKCFAYWQKEGTTYTPFKFSFPSYVSKGDLSLFSDNEVLYPRLVELHSKCGESFIISPDGDDEINPIPTGTYFYQKSMERAALVNYAVNQIITSLKIHPSRQINLILGLTMQAEHYYRLISSASGNKDQKKIDEVKEILTESFDFPHPILFSEVFAETTSSALDVLLDDRGVPNRTYKDESSIAVVDIGYGDTVITKFLIKNGLPFIKSRKSLNTSISKNVIDPMKKKIENLLFEKHPSSDITTGVPQSSVLLNKDSFEFWGYEHNIVSLRRKCLSQLISALTNVIHSQLKSGDGLKAVILTGGGVSMLNREIGQDVWTDLREMIPITIEHSDPVFSNALGALKATYHKFSFLQRNNGAK
jgi:hypothetical protein